MSLPQLKLLYTCIYTSYATLSSHILWNILMARVYTEEIQVPSKISHVIKNCGQISTPEF